jgi:hypothetical protein
MDLVLEGGSKAGAPVRAIGFAHIEMAVSHKIPGRSGWGNAALGLPARPAGAAHRFGT